MSVKQEGLRIIEETNYDSGTLTIEKRLHLYESHPDKSARSAVMWHAWNQNKAWLSRLLELTLASFPSYSRHDASHAEAVLHNIEPSFGRKQNTGDICNRLFCDSAYRIYSRYWHVYSGS